MKVLTGNKPLYYTRVPNNHPVVMAQHLLDRDDVVILDTETTGFTGEVIELAIINTQGRKLYSSRFLPSMMVEAAATAVHGITYNMLRDEPTFAAQHDVIRQVLDATATHLIYNAPFDVARLNFTCDLYRLPLLPLRPQCLMKMRGKRIKLGGGHSALQDCLKAWELLKELSRA